MNTVYVYIEDTLDPAHQAKLCQRLAHLPHVHHVELRPQAPHDMLVEFDPHHNVPTELMASLQAAGVHSDITAC